MDELTNPFERFNHDWALVTSGSRNQFNSMTISWGSMGTIWGKSVITVYIRPERFTCHFVEENDYFTVSFYEEKYRKQLVTMGNTSGRDTDKVKATGFHPLFLKEGITYQEASVTYVLKKLYTQQLDKSKVPPFTIERYYGEDGLAHVMFIGEVIEVIKK